MSEKNSSKGEPVEPELVDESGPEAPQSGGPLRRLEQTPQATSLVDTLTDFFGSPRREARRTREWADAVQAHTEFEEARVGLSRARKAVQSLPKILAADEEQRDIDLMRLKNQRSEEERIAKHKALQDELAEEEIRAKIAEARRRRQQAENPAPPPDEDSRRREAVAKKFRERMGRRFTEHEVRAHADQLIAEIRARAEGEITPAIQREIDNVTDVRDRLLDEL